MSTDPTPNAAPPATASVSASASAIENEIPAYRAIEPRAVFALLLGVLSVLSFVSVYLLAFAVLAVLVGVLADRRIQKYPDLYTGRGMAQAGIGLGLVFGLAAVSVDTVQTALRGRQASAFARTFEQVLQKADFDACVWWSQPPGNRANQAPDALVKELTGSGQQAHMFEEQFGSFRKLRKAIADDGATVHFDRLEEHGMDGLTPYAAALYEVHDPKAAAGETEQYALAYIKAMKGPKGPVEWWVQNFTYPAKPGSFTVPSKPADDGHGHAH